MLIVWEGEFVVEGDLILDHRRHGKASPIHREELDFMVVRGNLHVKGSPINEEGDCGLGLLVFGEMKANHAILGGSESFIGGDIDLQGYGLAHYNHGNSISKGDGFCKSDYRTRQSVSGQAARRSPGSEVRRLGVHSLADILLPAIVDEDYL